MVDYSPQAHSLCFPFLTREEAEKLLAAMDRVDIDAGATLYSSDEPAVQFYVLVAGRIAVQKHTGFGARMQVVALLDPGAPFGESALSAGQQRGATLTAVVSCQMLTLSSGAFASLAVAQSELAVKLLTWVVGKMSLRLKKSSERLARVL